MTRYIARRVLYLIPVWLGISILAFSLALLAPGDPVWQTLQASGIDAPSAEQVQALVTETHRHELTHEVFARVDAIKPALIRDDNVVLFMRTYSFVIRLSGYGVDAADSYFCNRWPPRRAFECDKQCFPLI